MYNCAYTKATLSFNCNYYNLVNVNLNDMSKCITLSLTFEIYNQKVFKYSLYFIYTQFERFFNFDKPFFLVLKSLESLHFVVYKLNFFLPFLTVVLVIQFYKPL